MEETQQINACIGEMAKLKEKMEALEKQKILNEKNEMLKKTTMEPNLQVLEKWLVDYHTAIEDKIKKFNNSPESIRRRNNIINNIKQYISMINNQHNDYQRLKKRGGTYKYPNIDFNELEMMSISLENEPYNILMYKQNKLKQICQNGNYIEPPQSKEKIEASRIEATYNMFNIINKRLDDIEKKLGINS